VATVAEIVRIADKEFKKRGPLAVWLINFVTAGIYFYVWYFKINREAREYLGDPAINPTVALLAVLVIWIPALIIAPLALLSMERPFHPPVVLVVLAFAGILLVIPALISVFNTGKRIGRMQGHAGVQDQISPGIGLLLFLVMRLDMPYQQEHLNRIWNRYLQAQSATPLLGPEQPLAPPTQAPPEWPPGGFPPPPGQLPPPPGQLPPPPGRQPPQGPGGFTE
jgi:hypothetical protein